VKPFWKSTKAPTRRGDRQRIEAYQCVGWSVFICGAT